MIQIDARLRLRPVAFDAERDFNEEARFNEVLLHDLDIAGALLLVDFWGETAGKPQDPMARPPILTVLPVCTLRLPTTSLRSPSPTGVGP